MFFSNNSIIAFCVKYGLMTTINAYTNDQVILDFPNKDPNSSIVDVPSTKVIGGKMAKIISWYGNEWGFSNRMVELFYIFSEKGGYLALDQLLPRKEPFNFLKGKS